MEKINHVSETEIKLEIELVQCSYYAVYSLVPIIRPAQIAHPVGILYQKNKQPSQIADPMGISVEN